MYSLYLAWHIFLSSRWPVTQCRRAVDHPTFPRRNQSHGSVRRRCAAPGQMRPWTSGTHAEPGIPALAQNNGGSISGKILAKGMRIRRIPRWQDPERLGCPTLGVVASVLSYLFQMRQNDISRNFWEKNPRKTLFRAYKYWVASAPVSALIQPAPPPSPPQPSPLLTVDSDDDNSDNDEQLVASHPVTDSQDARRALLPAPPSSNGVEERVHERLRQPNHVLEPRAVPVVQSGATVPAIQPLRPLCPSGNQRSPAADARDHQARGGPCARSRSLKAEARAYCVELLRICAGLVVRLGFIRGVRRRVWRVILLVRRRSRAERQHSPS